jgi:Protein of unknown function (DUF1565)
MSGTCGSVPPPPPPFVSEVPGPSAALLATPTYSGGVGTVYTCQRNFYVATTGSDANDGSQSSPWRTIYHADATALRAGDCVNVAAGTYVWNGSFDPRKGGNLASPIGYVTYRCQTLNACLIVYNGPPGDMSWGSANRGKGAPWTKHALPCASMVSRLNCLLRRPGSPGNVIVMSLKFD